MRLSRTLLAALAAVGMAGVAQAQSPPPPPYRIVPPPPPRIRPRPAPPEVKTPPAPTPPPAPSPDEKVPPGHLKGKHHGKGRGPHGEGPPGHAR